MKSFIKFCGNIPSISFNLLKEPRDFLAPICFSVCSSNVFPKEEYAKLAYSIFVFD